MIASLSSYLRDLPNVTVDGRADLRDQRLPAVIHGCYSTLSYQGTVGRLGSLPIVPCVVIRHDGHIFVYTAGGSALILVCGEEMNERQKESFEIVSKHLRSLGAIQGSSPFMRVL